MTTGSRELKRGKMEQDKRNNDPARTMRIDIHPDSAISGAPAIRPAAAASGNDDTTFLRRRETGRCDSPEYRKLLQCIYDGVIVTDMEGRILDCNDRAAEILKAGQSDLTGRQVIDLISGAEPKLLEEIRRNLGRHRYTLIEGRAVRCDGGIFPAEIAVNMMRLGESGQLCFFFRNISVRKKVQEDLEKAVARLEHHDRARAQFVSNVSHELRTPLTSMIYAVANLLRGVAGPIPDNVKRYLELLDGDCKRLLGTVSDILDMRKIESNQLQLAKSVAPFTLLVAESVESLRIHAREKALTVDFHAENEDLFVNCDALKMERVIFNVLGNSIKFTPAGGEISLRVSRDKDNRHMVRLAIRDTGVGIPKEALDKVTLRYFTVGEQPSGSGLGLAIAREIVDLHGGTIKIDSPPPGYDKGTVVEILLPLADSPVVLVADDDPTVVKVMKSQIEDAGYRVKVATDGEETLEMLDREKPDVLLLDLVLPKIGGTALLRRIKGEKKYRKVPVVAITGAWLDMRTAEAMRNFSVPLISKPWQPEELIARINAACLGVATLVSEPRMISGGIKAGEIGSVSANRESRNRSN